MLVHAHSFAINRGIAEHVHVELDTRGGLPAFSVIGLGAGAARDARERVQAAVLNSGFGFPRRRVTVNLAPAATRKGGPELDLVLACCVLAAEHHIDADRLARIGVFAELGLGGDLRPCESADAAAEAADRAGLAGLIVARGDLRQARGASRLPVAGLESLREVAAFLAGALPRSTHGPERGVASGSAEDRGARGVVGRAGARWPAAASSAGAPRPPPSRSARSDVSAASDRAADHGRR
jgi:magnesium chelatase family protein